MPLHLGFGAGLGQTPAMTDPVARRIDLQRAIAENLATHGSVKFLSGQVVASQPIDGRLTPVTLSTVAAILRRHGSPKAPPSGMTALISRSESYATEIRRLTAAASRRQINPGPTAFTRPVQQLTRLTASTPTPPKPTGDPPSKLPPGFVIGPPLGPPVPSPADVMEFEKDVMAAEPAMAGGMSPLVVGGLVAAGLVAIVLLKRG